MTKGRLRALLIVFALLIAPAAAKLPLNVFNGVTSSFPKAKRYLSPTLGMAALDGGIIDTLRLYGNYTPAYRSTLTGPERDYANDTSDDPLWQLVRILFPSTAGQLSADSTHEFNFGKYVKSPLTVALLIKFADDRRAGNPVDEEGLKNDLMASLGYKIQEKLTEAEKINLAFESFDADQGVIDGLITEAQQAIDDLNAYLIQNNNVADQKRIGQAKNELIRTLTKRVKRFDNAEVKALFMTKIRELYKLGSVKIAPSQKKRSPVDSDFFYQVKGELLKAKDAAEQLLEQTDIEALAQTKDVKQPKQRFITAFKTNTLTPLLTAITNAIAQEKSATPHFYPEYSPEQIISAFFCYKFSSRDDVITLLNHLNKLGLIGANTLVATDLLTPEQLPAIALKPDYIFDDILALATADIWTMPTPYRVGAAILSNGSTQQYDRKGQRFFGEDFADCVEISIRHLINCLLYNPKLGQFDFSGISAYRQNLTTLSPEQTAAFQAFQIFYQQQGVDLANDGSRAMRSQWNTVVGDLNGANESTATAIRYRRDNNELDAGFINLTRVFNRVLGITFDVEPAADAALADKKKWLENSFDKIFASLNPHKGYSLGLDMDKVVADQREISGIVTLTIYDQDATMLYAFDFRSDPDRHGQLQNYRVNDKFKAGSYNNHLLDSKVAAIGAENAIWLLAKEKVVRQTKEQTAPVFYQLFGQGLADNNAKIAFLNNIGEGIETLIPFLQSQEFKTMLKNTITNINFEDEETIRNTSPVLLRLLTREELAETITAVLKTAKFRKDYSRINSNDTVSLISAALKLNNPTFTSLHLKYNQIGDAGALVLAEALETNTTLTSLALGWNEIAEIGSTALAEALKTNAALTSLELQGNQIGEIGATAIAEALKTNSTLTLLDMEKTNISNAWALAMADTLKTNTTLTSLNIHENNIGDAGTTAVADALKSNVTLTLLDMGSNNIGNAGALAIAEAIKTNTSLTTLDLSSNQIDKAGFEELAKALKTNTTLTSLNLRGNAYINQMDRKEKTEVRKTFPKWVIF